MGKIIKQKQIKMKFLAALVATASAAHLTAVSASEYSNVSLAQVNAIIEDYNEREAWCKNKMKKVYEKNKQGCWVCGKGDAKAREKDCKNSGRKIVYNDNVCWVCQPNDQP